MDTWVWIVIAILVIAVVAGIVWAAMSRRRTATLQEQFGPEYERTMRTSESRRDAENELSARRERRAALDIRPLSASARDRYADAWRDVQTGFVDEPATSLVGEPLGADRDARARLPDGRLRTACRRHLGRSPGRRGALSGRERHLGRCRR